MHQHATYAHDRPNLDSRAHMDCYRRAYVDTRADLDT